VPLIAITHVQGTLGAHEQACTAAIAKRIAVINAGESSSSASRLATNQTPR